MPADAFTCFVGDGPGSATSISDGLSWLASAASGDKTGLIFIATLDALQHPSHVHEILGNASVQKLLDERVTKFRSRYVRLATERDVRSARRDLVHDGPVLALWPTLEHLRLLSSKLKAPCIGIVVWNYAKDVAPFFAGHGEKPDADE